MRRIAFYLGLFLFFQSNAQELKDSLPEFGNAPVIFGNDARPYLNLSYSFDAGSHDWATRQMLDFFFTGFLDDSKKQGLLEKVDNSLSLGALNSWQLDFVYKGHKQVKLLPIPKRSIYVFNRSYSSLKLSKELLSLALLGNKPFAGRNLSNLEMDYQSWFYSGLGFQFGLLWDTIPISLGLSVVGIHDFQSIRANAAQLLTASNGAYIDFEGNYTYQATESQSNLALRGMGIALSMTTEERWGRNQFRLEVNDLGLAYLGDLKVIDRDSSFRFTGLQIPRLLSGDEAFIEEQGDSLNGGLLGSEQQQAWQLLPFQLRSTYVWSYGANSNHQLGLDLNYIYLPTYLLRTQLFHQYNLKKLKVRTAVGYGGFRDWHLDVSLQWDFAKYWDLRLNWLNLPGFIIPEQFKGDGLSLSLRYFL